MQYKIIEGDFCRVEKEINCFLSRGWKLYGNLIDLGMQSITSSEKIFTKQYLAQAVIYDEKETSSINSPSEDNEQFGRLNCLIDKIEQDLKNLKGEK